MNGQSVKRRRNVPSTDGRQPIVVKVYSLERLQTLEGSGLDVGDVTLGQVELGQVLESVEGLRRDRLDGVAAEGEAHEGSRFAV